MANICFPIDVLPFSEPVARRFLAARLEGTGGSFTEREIEGLLQESGGHPARLQRAAARLYDRYVGWGE